MFSLVFGIKATARYFLCTKGLPFIAGRSDAGGRRGFKVSLVGSGGRVGQMLSLLLKKNPLIDQLHLHDMSASPTALEKVLSDICTKTEAKCFVGPEQLVESLTDANIVIFAVALPERPDTVDPIAGITSAVSLACPKALLAFVTQPINFVVPMAAEFLKAQNTYDPRRLFGVTTWHSLRIETFVSDVFNIDPARVSVPVIGGFSVDTSVPLLTQCCSDLREEKVDENSIIEKMENSEYHGLAAKTLGNLSKANAGALFIDSLLRGLNGEPDVIQCSFVGYEAPLCPFFATQVILGREGIQTNLGLPPLGSREEEALNRIVPVLLQNINDGVFMAKNTIDGDAKEANQEEEKTELN
ncbi:uncharacterized protein Dwil_GK22134 [Drosophila willistoni]|uniref:Malate dehydrogenase, mitochondrial n=1 Tax=Drosophila willistoni TaxID=7260 RepID=B4MY59_DROWI|nr:malate dehydrogenase, mitochondrial [Drosophila willistoni]EDW77048.2 uncharacterized protein Dwil_GK22134 [Drosophila willistoni]